MSAAEFRASRPRRCYSGNRELMPGKGSRACLAPRLYGAAYAQYGYRRRYDAEVLRPAS